MFIHIHLDNDTLFLESTQNLPNLFTKSPMLTILAVLAIVDSTAQRQQIGLEYSNVSKKTTHIYTHRLYRISHVPSHIHNVCMLYNKRKPTIKHS